MKFQDTHSEHDETLIALSSRVHEQEKLIMRAISRYRSRCRFFKDGSRNMRLDIHSNLLSLLGQAELLMKQVNEYGLTDAIEFNSQIQSFLTKRKLGRLKSQYRKLKVRYQLEMHPNTMDRSRQLSISLSAVS